MRTRFKLISGGQTGTDRAALDWAIQHRIPHGGWCPRNRKAEDGLIPSRYKLLETPLAAYSQRTEWNVRDSDGTVILSGSATLRGGSALTRRFAKRYGKPLLHLQLSAEHLTVAATQFREFVRQHRIKVLNIAGPRASEEPRIGKLVNQFLNRVGNSFFSKSVS